MPHYLDAVADSPCVPVVVFVVAGLDALLPFMPSESTVVACGVVAVSGLAVLVQHLATPATDRESVSSGQC